MVGILSTFFIIILPKNSNITLKEKEYGQMLILASGIRGVSPYLRKNLMGNNVKHKKVELLIFLWMIKQREAVASNSILIEPTTSQHLWEQFSSSTTSFPKFPILFHGTDWDQPLNAHPLRDIKVLNYRDLFLLYSFWF